MAGMDPTISKDHVYCLYIIGISWGRLSNFLDHEVVFGASNRRLFRPSLRRSTSAQWLPWESNHKRLKLKVAFCFSLACAACGVLLDWQLHEKVPVFCVCFFRSIIMFDQKWEANVKAFPIIPIDPDTLYSCKMCKFYLIIYVHIIYIHMYTWNQILIDNWRLYRSRYAHSTVHPVISWIDLYNRQSLPQGQPCPRWI